MSTVSAAAPRLITAPPRAGVMWLLRAVNDDASLAHLGSDPAVTGRATMVWSNAVPAPLAWCGRMSC